MRMWFEVNQHKERSIRTFKENGSGVEIIICQVILITARLIVPFNMYLHKYLLIFYLSRIGKKTKRRSKNTSLKAKT